MTGSLADRLQLRDRELISVVGAGGKTTTVKTLGHELATRGARVVVTTTTKMGRDQVGSDAICSSDPAEVALAVESRSPLFVACSLTDAKVTGPSPEQVDALFGHPGIDHVIVEADGARKMLIKAPAEHEPQIPSLATTVLVVASAKAIGRPISDVAHRPARAAHLAGASPGDLLTEEHVSRILCSKEGGLRGIPSGARKIALLTGATWVSDTLAAVVKETGVFDDVVTLALDERETPAAPSDPVSLLRRPLKGE